MKSLQSLLVVLSTTVGRVLTVRPPSMTDAVSRDDVGIVPYGETFC